MTPFSKSDIRPFRACRGRDKILSWPVHTNGPLQNFGLLTLNFQPPKTEFPWREWQKILGWQSRDLAKWAWLSVFSCDQAALWMVQFVRLSVCHTFLTMFPSSYHHKIFRSYYQWQKWRPCKRSRLKVKVTEVNTKLSRTVTPVWIHIWWWNDPQSLMWLRRGALLFLKVIRQIWRSLLKILSILTQIRRSRTVTPVWIHQWLRNDAQSLK